MGQVWEIRLSRTTFILLLVGEPGVKLQATCTLATSDPLYFPEGEIDDWDVDWFSFEDATRKRLA